MKFDKEFLGKEALELMRNDGARRNLVSFAVSTDIATAHPGDSILKDGKVVGTVTSAGWGHRTGTNICYAFVDANVALESCEIEIVGEAFAVSAISQPIFDPDNLLPKG